MKIETSKVVRLRELTGVGMIEGKEILEANQGSLEKSIEYLRATGDEPGYSGLTIERWVITKHDGIELEFDNYEDFSSNYKPMRGDGGKHISPVGRYIYFK